MILKITYGDVTEVMPVYSVKFKAEASMLYVWGYEREPDDKVTQIPFDDGWHAVVFSDSGRELARFDQ